MKKERDIIFIPTATVISFAEQVLLLCKMLENAAQSDKPTDKSEN